MKTTNHTVYHSRLKADLCVACGEVPPIPEKIMCVGCRDNHNEYIRNKRKERAAKAMCQYCTDPVSKLCKDLCEKHRLLRAGPCDICNSNEHTTRGHTLLGLCCKCAEPRIKVRGLKSYCFQHGTEQLAIVHNRQKNIRADLKAKGICMYGCGPVAPWSDSRCENCLKKNAAGVAAKAKKSSSSISKEESK